LKEGRRRSYSFKDERRESRIGRRTRMALLTRVLACFGGNSIEVKDISLTDYIQVSKSSDL